MVRQWRQQAAFPLGYRSRVARGSRDHNRRSLFRLHRGSGLNLWRRDCVTGNTPILATDLFWLARLRITPNFFWLYYVRVEEMPSDWIAHFFCLPTQVSFMDSRLV